MKTVLLLIFFFPYGLYRMWKREEWDFSVKAVISAFYCFLPLGGKEVAFEHVAITCISLCILGYFIYRHYLGDREKTLLFFSTKQAKIPDNYRIDPVNPDRVPQMIHLAWQVYNGRKQKMSEGNYYIRHEKAEEVETDASSRHGITNQELTENGVPLEQALASFRSSVKIVSEVVSHNYDYHSKVVNAECTRAGQLPILPENGFCMMKKTVNILKLPKNNRHHYADSYKYPSFDELYKFCLQLMPPPSRNAMDDVKALVKCYFMLKGRFRA